MTKRNSLTAFKKPTSPILPVSALGDEPKIVDQTKVGRKPKPKAEKQAHRVTLSLTSREKEICDVKSGLVNSATHIHQFLKDHGYFE